MCLVLNTRNHCPLPFCYLPQGVCTMFCHQRRRRCTCPRRPQPHRWWLVFGTRLHFWSRTCRWLWSPSCSCTTSPLHWPETLGTQGDHGVCTWQSYPWVSSQTWRAALQQRQYWINRECVPRQLPRSISNSNLWYCVEEKLHVIPSCFHLGSSSDCCASYGLWTTPVHSRSCLIANSQAAKQ